jgi:VanZ family protein
MIRKVLQASAWLLALAIVVLSVVPPLYRPVVGVSHGVEHLLIFLATGLAFGLGYPKRHEIAAIGLVTFAGAIEVAQLFTPGRHARMSDFVIDAATACIGVALSWGLEQVRKFLFQAG